MWSKESLFIDLQRHRWRIGLLFLSVVVLLWVASGFMVNAMSVDYSKPYFITYINTGTFVLYLTPTVVRYFRENSPRILNRRRSLQGLLGDEVAVSTTENPSAFTVRETALLSSQFACLWFVSNLLNNASYIYTSVSSATIISCTSSFFTLIVGSIFGVEKFTGSKFGALCVSIGGIWLISTADHTSESAPRNAMLGNLLSLASAFFYGVYTTLLKVRIGDESRIDTRMFFGFVGLFNILLLWPFIIIFNYTGLESFGLPTSTRVWTLLITNGVATLVSDFCWVLAMLMTSPLVVTVGLNATIPLSMIGEMIVNARFASVLYYIGACLICWSFFFINRHEESEAVPVEPITDDDL
jgi:solute carrier family 35 protein F5